MKFKRTPDSCFGNLADYPFAPNYLEVDDQEGGKLRMHYVDEGPKDGQLVVMIHGNPTWSYMWRKLIPVLAGKGYRPIAIDLIGSGRSDKPTKMTDYTIGRHEAWVKQAVFEEIGVKDAHFILHDCRNCCFAHLTLMSRCCATMVETPFEQSTCNLSKQLRR